MIGLLGVFLAVCKTCSESYDGRAKHVCKLTRTTDVFTASTTDTSTAWFETVQSTLSGLIAVDWAKSGTVIDRVLNVQYMTREAAALVYELPLWLMEDKGWEIMPCVIIVQGEPGMNDSLNPVLVHQATLIRGMAAFLKTMQDSDHLFVGFDGEWVIKPHVELSFELVKVGGRSRYEVTFVIPDDS